MQDTQEMRVWALGREDLLEEGVATHSSILAWRTPWTEESCCSEEGKKGVGIEFFSFPFLRTKKIKRKVSRSGHS